MHSSPFPSTASSKARPWINDLNVYCSCRLPYVLEHIKKEEVQTDGDVQMFQCDFCNNRYQSSCANLTVARYSNIQSQVSQDCVNIKDSVHI